MELDMAVVYPIDKSYYDDPPELEEAEQQKRNSLIEKYRADYESGSEVGGLNLLCYLLPDKSFRAEALDLAKKLLVVPTDISNFQGLVYHKLSELYVAVEDYDTAIAILKEGLEKNPFDFFLCRGLIAIWLHQKEYSKAILLAIQDYLNIKDHFFSDDEELENSEDHYRCKVVGLCFMQNRQYTVALPWFNLAFYERDLRNEDLASLYFHIGTCWLHLQDEYRALDAYKKALNIQPNFPELFVHLGHIARDFQQDFREAIRYYQLAINSENISDDVEILAWSSLRDLYGQILEFRKEEHARKMVEGFETGVFPQYSPDDVDTNVDDDDDDDDDVDIDNDDDTLESM